MTVVIEQAKPQIDRLRYSLSSQVASKVFQLLVTIGIGGWTARYLGPAELGKLSYVAALVGILSPLGSLGVKGSLSALLCEINPLPGLVSTAFCIELIGTLLIGIVLIPFALLSGDPLIGALFGFAILSNLFGSSEVLEAELLNRHRGTVIARTGFIQVFSGALFSVVALLARAPLLAFGGIQFLQSIVKFALLFHAVAIQSFNAWLASASLAAAKPLIRRGWPLMLSGFAIMIYMKSDQVMLEWLRGAQEVGQYSVAVRVAESLYFLPLVIGETFTPRLKHGLESKDLRDVASMTLKQLYRIAWILGLSMTIGTAVLLPPLLLLVFGHQYDDSAHALKFLAPAGFAVATGCASGAWLNVNGYADHLAKRTSIGAVVNIVLNFWLIPSFGIVGAAIATSISYIMSVFLYGLFDSRTKSNTLFLLSPL